MKVQVRNLTKIYPNGVQALDNLSLDIPEGSFVAVIGSSGSGKSSFIRCINRIHEPTSGSVLLNNQNILELQEKELRQLRLKIGMIFQQFNLINRKSVLHNVLLGRLGRLKNQWTSTIFNQWPENWIEEAIQALSMVGLSNKLTVRADALSGGQQQRVAIARVLFQDPSLLLADEPVASLDPKTGRRIMDDLKTINQSRKVTVLCNLHFLSLVRDYADHVIALRQGHLVFQGSPKELTKELCAEIYGGSAHMDYN